VGIVKVYGLLGAEASTQRHDALLLAAERRMFETLLADGATSFSAAHWIALDESGCEIHLDSFDSKFVMQDGYSSLSYSVGTEGGQIVGTSDWNMDRAAGVKTLCWNIRIDGRNSHPADDDLPEAVISEIASLMDGIGLVASILVPDSVNMLPFDASRFLYPDGTEPTSATFGSVFVPGSISMLASELVGPRTYEFEREVESALNWTAEDLQGVCRVARLRSTADSELISLRARTREFVGMPGRPPRPTF
jgi:hypothetical protein